jgi:uncharacterized protein YndB with AHSA1/START domain
MDDHETRPIRIRREDAILIQAVADEIFNVLVDVHSYEKWWPRSLRFRVADPGPVKVGTRVWISNGALVRWIAEVTVIEKNHRMAFHYAQGAWEGTAAWTLRPEPGGTRVSYAIDIVPVPFWLKALGTVLDLGAIHSKQMQGVLEHLQAHLGSTDRPRTHHT